MLVVADSSPLIVLVGIGHIEVHANSRTLTDRPISDYHNRLCSIWPT